MAVRLFELFLDQQNLRNLTHTLESLPTT